MVLKGIGTPKRFNGVLKACQKIDSLFYILTVDETYRQLSEGGYGFVRGEAICGPTTSGHDYRITAEIFAGVHRGFGISDEVHLPCNV